MFFGLLILVHEAGHFAAARICGVGINEFAVGMGPTVLSHKAKKSGTQFSLRLLPIGGFVSMVGEDEEGDPNDPRALYNKGKLQRLFVFSAGALTNILIGFLAMLIYVSLQPAYPSTTIAEVENSVLAQYGVMDGDEIIEVDGKSVNIAGDITDAIMLSGGEPIDFTILRGGERITVEDVVFDTVTQDGVVMGMIDFKFYGVKRSFSQIIKQTVFGVFNTIKLIFSSFWMLITGEVGVEAMSGPVGTVNVVAQAASMGWQTLLYFFVVISMNLGVFNLLPFPALDGGHILFLAIEAVIRRPVSKKVEGIIHAVGFALLITLIVFVTFKDVTKIFM